MVDAAELRDRPKFTDADLAAAVRIAVAAERRQAGRLEHF